MLVDQMYAPCSIVWSLTVSALHLSTSTGQRKDREIRERKDKLAEVGTLFACRRCICDQCVSPPYHLIRLHRHTASLLEAKTKEGEELRAQLGKRDDMLVEIRTLFACRRYICDPPHHFCTTGKQLEASQRELEAERAKSLKWQQGVAAYLSAAVKEDLLQHQRDVFQRLRAEYEGTMESISRLVKESDLELEATKRVLEATQRELEVERAKFLESKRVVTSCFSAVSETTQPQGGDETGQPDVGGESPPDASASSIPAALTVTDSP
jgi:hypothetical protein